MKNVLMILMIGLAATLFAAQSNAAQISGVDIHGFISQGYLHTTENNLTEDTKNGTFAFNEVGINFGKELNDNLRLGVQLFSRSFGDVGNNELKIDWAFLDYRFRDWLGLRMGQIKTPHGIHNEIRDIDMLRNPIFLPQCIYPEVTRDVYLSLLGGGIYGFIDMNQAGVLSYQALFGTQDIDANSKVSENLIGIYSDVIENDSFDVDYKYAGNIAWDTPLNGLRLGVSLDNIVFTINSRFTKDIIGYIPGRGLVTFANEGELSTIEYNKLQNWIGSLEYTWGDFIVMGEYIKTFKDYVVTAFGNVEEVDNTLSGWYMGGAYRVTDWLELGAYYSQTRNDPPLMQGQGGMGHPPAPDFYDELDDICLTTRFDFNEYWTLKLEGHSFNGAFGLSSWDNPKSPATGARDYDNFVEEWKLFAAKLTVAF